MKIAMTGATGFIGNALKASLKSSGHIIVTFSASQWAKDNYVNCSEELSVVEGFDAFIHLAGESIADGLWSKKKRKKILESRTQSTRHILAAFSKQKNPPKKIFLTSAIGFYGNRGEEELNESAKKGTGFLSDVCFELESLPNNFQNLQNKIITLRLGLVLSNSGGLVKQIIPLFKNKLGAILGSGKQWMSFIHLDDLQAVYLHLLNHPTAHQTYNATAPHPVRNEEWSKHLWKKYPPFFQFKIPSLFLTLLFRQKSQLFLDSAKVIPQNLLNEGFVFSKPELGEF